jgi:Flp pilus assembly protein TadB
MILEPLVCAGCGAAIEAADDAPPVACPHCGARVTRQPAPAPAEGASFVGPASLQEAAREVERIAAEAEGARLRSELERMDREWRAYCEQRSGKPMGLASGSLSNGALMILVFGILLVLLGLVVDFSFMAAAPGVLVIIGGLAACVASAARDARRATDTARQYETRRAEIVRRLEAGG